VTEAKAIEALEAADYPVNDDTIAQMGVFLRAMNKYLDREEEYGSTWKQFDAPDAAHHAKHKAARMEATAQPSEDQMVAKLSRNAAIDSAEDICNYAAFFIRHIEGTK